MVTFLEPLRAPVTALVASLAAALLAWAWFNDHRGPAVAGAVILVLAGWTCLSVGDLLLPGHPVAAVRVMNWTALAYVAILAVAGAAAIVVTVALAVGDDASDQVKEMWSAVTAAVTTFLGAIVVASDKSDSAVGDAVKARFYAHYGRDDDDHTPVGSRYVDDTEQGRRLFPADSDGVNALYGEGWGNILGWDSDARLDRAKAIAKYMSSGTPKVPPVNAA